MNVNIGIRQCNNVTFINTNLDSPHFKPNSAFWINDGQRLFPNKMEKKTHSHL
jgi:hypothetical protein